MGQAVKLALGTLDKDTRTIINMRNYIVDRILGEIPDVTLMDLVLMLMPMSMLFR